MTRCDRYHVQPHDDRCDFFTMQTQGDIARDAVTVRRSYLEGFFVLNADGPSRQDYRVSHQATGAGIHYDKTFDARYCAALWQARTAVILGGA